MVEQTGDHLRHVGKTRTDLYCHNCSNNFIAELDFDINGDHKIQCAYCSHIHYRKIQDGKITEARWSSDNDSRSDNSYPALKVWKSDVIVAQTSSASHFMRSRWLEKMN